MIWSMIYIHKEKYWILDGCGPRHFGRLAIIHQTPRIAEMETKRYERIYSVHFWNTLRDIRAVQV